MYRSFGFTIVMDCASYTLEVTEGVEEVLWVIENIRNVSWEVDSSTKTERDTARSNCEMSSRYNVRSTSNPDNVLDEVGGANGFSVSEPNYCTIFEEEMMKSGSGHLSVVNIHPGVEVKSSGELGGRLK